MNEPTQTYLRDDMFTTKAVELVQQAYDAGFQAGYQAALDTVMLAARDASGAIATLPDENSAIRKTASGRAAPGVVKDLVRRFVLTAGRPVSEGDFRMRYPAIGRPSRYMAFRSLGADKEIVKEGEFWVPALNLVNTN